MGFFFVNNPVFEIQNDTGKGIINVTLSLSHGTISGRPMVFGKCETTQPGNLVRQPCRYFYTKYPAYSNGGNIILRFARDNNLQIIIASIMIFYQFTLWHFSSRIINYLAGYVLPYICFKDFLSTVYNHCMSHMQTATYLFCIFMGTLVSICLTTLVIEWSRRLLLGKIENKLAKCHRKKEEQK